MTALLEKEDVVRVIFVMERCTESLKDHITLSLGERNHRWSSLYARSRHYPQRPQARKHLGTYLQRSWYFYRILPVVVSQWNWLVKYHTAFRFCNCFSAFFYYFFIFQSWASKLLEFLHTSLNQLNHSGKSRLLGDTQPVKFITRITLPVCIQDTVIHIVSQRKTTIPRYFYYYH